MTDTDTLTNQSTPKPGTRIPNAVHAARTWTIHTITADFILEDVWRLPVEGGADDFGDLVAMMSSEGDLLGEMPGPARFLVAVRDRLGGVLSLGRIHIDTEKDSLSPVSIAGSDDASLSERLPADLRDTATDVRFDSVPFSPLFRTDNEFAAEMSNRTVHAVMHLAWVEDSPDRFHGEMAVYVKPRGIFGHTYMGIIKPFRYLIVYPALLKQMERAWTQRTPTARR